jgi:hypothetical protein
VAPDGAKQRAAQSPMKKAGFPGFFHLIKPLEKRFAFFE